MAPDYASQSNGDLTKRYNELREKAGEKPVGPWKGKKSDLIAKIEVLELRSEAQFSSKQQEKLQQSIAEEKAAPTPEPVTEKPKAKQKPAKRKKSDDGRTIREASLDLLALVDYYEDKTKASNDENRVDADHKHARSVGLPYLEIIRRVKEEFDGAETSVACLRWYSVKVRDFKNHPEYSGWKLPQRRPRATSKGK